MKNWYLLTTAFKLKFESKNRFVYIIVIATVNILFPPIDFQLNTDSRDVSWMKENAWKAWKSVWIWAKTPPKWAENE